MQFLVAWVATCEARLLSLVMKINIATLIIISMTVSQLAIQSLVHTQKMTGWPNHFLIKKI